MPEEFGDALRRLRREREVSLRSLAQLVHYSKGYLSKIENGEKPPTADVARRCDAALAAEGALSHLLAARTPGDRCPYPGLAAYTAADAPWFFGRERATAALVGRLAERMDSAGPLVLAAPSGAGKSSLLRAGLLPALRAGALPGSRHWPVRVLTPGAHPLTELAAALAGPGTPCAASAEELAEAPERCAAAVRAALGPGPRLVLVVDQFEEVFTACEDSRERRAFVTALCTAARDAPCAVVIGVRADFYGPCLDHPALAPALSAGVFALRPMSVREVRAAITRPAREAALELEPGLEELLLSDLGIHGDDEPVAGGTLPLLAHALLATWQQRSGRTLTVAGYRLTGGLHGAVATTAERVHAGLDPAERRTARQVLLRLVQVGEIAGETRRRVPHERLLEHLPDPEKTAAVIDVFVRARLLTLDADTVEITHEALLRAWPRLRGWIRADRAGLVVHQRLTEAAGAWKREGRDPAALYRGTRLAVAREWAGQQGRTPVSVHWRRSSCTPRRSARRPRPVPTAAGCGGAAGSRAPSPCCSCSPCARGCWRCSSGVRRRPGAVTRTPVNWPPARLRWPPGSPRRPCCSPPRRTGCTLPRLPQRAVEHPGPAVRRAPDGASRAGQRRRVQPRRQAPGGRRFGRHGPAVGPAQPPPAGHRARVRCAADPRRRLQPGRPSSGRGRGGRLRTGPGRRPPYARRHRARRR